MHTNKKFTKILKLLWVQFNLNLGINNFDSDPSRVLGFSVSILNSTKTGIKFDIKLNSNANWKQMRVNFLSSTRSDV